MFEAMGEIVLQTAAGLFFVLSGYHKLMNSERHKNLAATLAEDLPKLGIPAALLPFMCWWVPGWEFAAGLVASFSIFWHIFGLAVVAKLACLPMIAIMAVALYTEGKGRVAEYGPIDLADVLDDWLYLPETLLLIMAVAAVLA